MFRVQSSKFKVQGLEFKVLTGLPVDDCEDLYFISLGCRYFKSIDHCNSVKSLFLQYLKTIYQSSIQCYQTLKPFSR